MHPNSHRILIAFAITVVACTITAGIFSVGYVVGYHQSQRNAAFFINKNFPPIPNQDHPPTGSGMKQREDFPKGPVGLFGKEPDHKFAMNGIVQTVNSGSLLLQDGRRVVKRVLFVPETKVRDGGRELSLANITSGMHVSVLGRDIPGNPSDVNAMIIMIRKK